MVSFDAERFAQEVLSPVRSLLDNLSSDSAGVRVEMAQLRQDIEAILAALEVERDSRRSRALKLDLEKFLPARKAAILSEGEKASFSPETVTEMSRLLEMACFAALSAAKAFVVTSW